MCTLVMAKERGFVWELRMKVLEGPIVLTFIRVYRKMFCV